LIGTSLGHFRITALLGEGGMGAVYRAEDRKLGREVAIKVLPADFAQDADRLERFEREARAVASLSHPNILAIHDFGTAEGITYAVTELLEGETLRERLDRAALPARKAADIARQVAQGLAAAHDQGVVHRDLKPDNLFLTRDGRVKILDFGLAKVEAESVGEAVTEAPTQTQHTDPGTVLGTVGYMAPEQVRGEPADARSDIFSLGVVLYEMLTGERAFQAASRIETMTAILKEDPPEIDPTAHPVPAALQRILYRCLEKAPAERFQSARDLAFALSSAGESSTSASGIAVEAAAPAQPATGQRRAWALAAGALAVGLLAGLLLGGPLLGGWGGAAVPPEPHRIRTLTFSGHDSDPSVSPDGNLVAFASDRDATSRIWLKQLTGGGEEPLTEGEDFLPRFSPDGGSILFLRRRGANTAVFRTNLVGGQPRELIERASEADWSPDGSRIVYCIGALDESRSMRIEIADVRDGASSELAVVENSVVTGPRWSPDGGTIAAIASPIAGNAAQSRILLIDVATGEQRRIDPIEPAARLSPPTWLGRGEALVYALSTALVGDQAGGSSRVVRYDLAADRHRTLFWTENLFPVLGGGADESQFDVIGPGRLVYDELVVRQNLELYELSARGPSSVRRSLTAGNADDRQPAYSPDGSALVFTSNRGGNLDIWLYEMESGAIEQLTDDEANDWDPGWTPDGTGIVWSSNRSGNLEIWTAARDGSGARQVSSDGFDAENPTVTPDGWVIYWSSNPDKLGVWKVRLDGSESVHLAKGRYLTPDVSPDGRHLTMLTLDPFRTVIRVVEVATGEVVPFEIVVPHWSGSSILWGRSRWLPDGRAIAFVGVDEQGRSGVFRQDFVPGKDTSSTRAPLAGFSPDFVTESFAIDPSGRYLTLSGVRQVASLIQVEGLPGIEPPVRAGAAD
jgi:Tol biopolymer transport system component